MTSPKKTGKLPYKTNFDPDYVQISQMTSRIANQPSMKQKPPIEQLKNQFLQLSDTIQENQLLFYPQEIYTRFSTLKEAQIKMKTRSQLCPHCGKQPKKVVQCDLCAQVYCKDCCWRKRCIPGLNEKEPKNSCQVCHRKFVKLFNNQNFYQEKELFYKVIETTKTKTEKAIQKSSDKQKLLYVYNMKKRNDKIKENHLLKQIEDEEKKLKQVDEEFRKLVNEKAEKIKLQQQKNKELLQQKKLEAEKLQAEQQQIKRKEAQRKKKQEQLQAKRSHQIQQQKQRQKFRIQEQKKKLKEHEQHIIKKQERSKNTKSPDSSLKMQVNHILEQNQQFFPKKQHQPTQINSSAPKNQQMRANNQLQSEAELLIKAEKEGVFSVNNNKNEIESNKQDKMEQDKKQKQSQQCLLAVLVHQQTKQEYLTSITTSKSSQQYFSHDKKARQFQADTIKINPNQMSLNDILNAKVQPIHVSNRLSPRKSVSSQLDIEGNSPIRKTIEDVEGVEDKRSSMQALRASLKVQGSSNQEHLRRNRQSLLRNSSLMSSTKITKQSLPQHEQAIIDSDNKCTCEIM